MVQVSENQWEIPLESMKVELFLLDCLMDFQWDSYLDSQLELVKVHLLASLKEAQMGHCLESYSVAYSDGYLAKESEIMMVLEWGNA
jgi:hypothetical protein